MKAAWLGAMALALVAVSPTLSASAEIGNACADDAMIVFDASGSMSGNEKLGIATTVTRIDEVRSALAKVLPSVTRFRRVGLITYGPGTYNQCNVTLNLKPLSRATDRIMRELVDLIPAGKTPLASAVEQAAEVLEYRRKPGVVVVVTDGEETCGGSPCALGKRLHQDGLRTTVHVIGFRTENFAWTGEQSVLEAKCLAEVTGGLYVSAETREELIDAFEKTLGCPAISERYGLSEAAPFFVRADMRAP